jgi:hypothetical protein
VPGSQLGLQSPEIVESGGQPGVFRRGSGTVEPLPLPESQPAPLLLPPLLLPPLLLPPPTLLLGA